MNKPVLLVSHDLGRAGAQRFLIHFMRWLREHPSFDFELLVAGPDRGLSGAPGYALRAEAESLAPVHWLDGEGRPTNLPALRDGAYGLIHLNTSVLGPLLASLDAPAIPVTCHVHELGHFIEARLGQRRFDLLKPRVGRWVACADVVRDMLVGRLGVQADTVEVIPEAVPASALSRVTVDREAARARLRVGRGTFVLACCGTLDWRKGADLVVPLAQAIRRAAPALDFCIAWFGAEPHREEYARVLYETGQADLLEAVRLIEPVDDMAAWYGAADVFTLLSREDPFPLAMLEAAACRLPVVGFDGSGGIREFVREGTGFTVPFLDLTAMGSVLAAMAARRDETRTMGSAARQRALDFDVEAIMPRLAELLERASTP